MDQQNLSAKFFPLLKFCLSVPNCLFETDLVNLLLHEHTLKMIEMLQTLWAVKTACNEVHFQPNYSENTILFIKKVALLIFDFDGFPVENSKT